MCWQPHLGLTAHCILFRTQSSLHSSKIIIKVARVFTPKWVCTHINTTSGQVLKMYLSLSEQKRQHVAGIMKHNHTKQVYVSFFIPLKVKANLKLKVYNEFTPGCELDWVRNSLHGIINFLFVVCPTLFDFWVCSQEVWYLWLANRVFGSITAVIYSVI